MTSGTLTRTGRPAPPRGGRPRPPAASSRPAGSRIDPRFDERRREVARGRNRRRRRRVAAAAVALVLVGGAVALTRSAALDVDLLRVEGASGLRADQVREASGLHRGDALVSVDAGRVAARVEALAWVADARVERSWRGTVTVTVATRTPVAVAGPAGSAVLVDAEGRALAPAGGADLAHLRGPAPAVGRFAGPDGRLALRVLAGLPADLRGQVAEVTAGDDGVVLTLDDGITVRMGDDTRLAAKAQALAALLDLPGRDTVERIDVRAPSTPSLVRSSTSDGPLTAGSTGGA